MSTHQPTNALTKNVFCYMIGVDIIKVSRIENAISRWGDIFLNKLFTINEKEYCKNKNNLAQCYAGRFAVKESFYKVKNHNYGWKAIEVLSEKKPKIRILNNELQTEMKNIDIHVSLSHTEDNAIAIVLMTKKN
jgi:holo-[acyl-carrier protein] synthase